jgi:plastocyanin
MAASLLSIFVLVFVAAASSLHAAAAGSVRVEIKDPAGTPVADAVAWLTPLDAKPTLTPPSEAVVVAQHDEEFHPFVTAIVAGTQVRFPNQDHIAHHVFSQSKAKSFEIPRYRGEPKDTIVFDQPGIVALGCNIHDWMLAYIVVVGTPHFAKSPANGVVPLATLPAGRYRLEVWHPRAKEMISREVNIAENDTATQLIAVTLRPDKRIRRAPESGVGGYK